MVQKTVSIVYAHNLDHRKTNAKIGWQMMLHKTVNTDFRHYTF